MNLGENPIVQTVKLRTRFDEFLWKWFRPLGINVHRGFIGDWLSSRMPVKIQFLVTEILLSPFSGYTYQLLMYLRNQTSNQKVTCNSNTWSWMVLRALCVICDISTRPMFQLLEQCWTNTGSPMFFFPLSLTSYQNLLCYNIMCLLSSLHATVAKVTAHFTWITF